MKLNNFSVLILLLTIAGTTSSVAQTRNDTLRVKAGKYLTNKFPGTRFLDFQYEQFSPTNYTSTLYGKDFEKGILSSQKRFKAALNFPIYMKEKFIISSSWRYKYETLSFKDVESYLVNEIGLQHDNHEDFHFFSGAFSFTYRSMLFNKNIVYNANLITDGSHKGFERFSATFLAVMVMKRNHTTTMTLGAQFNTSPTAIFFVLPVFSLEHKLNDTWMLDLTFPKYGYIRKDVFGNGRLSAGIRYEGELFFTYPKQTGFMDTYTYNRNEIRTELMYEHHLSKNVIVTLRGGGTNVFWGQMKVKNSSDKLIKTSQNMNMFFNVGVSYNLIRK